jgi:triacylglycerol esterase/lipase EstA (alpha/beta hydrolase family)
VSNDELPQNAPCRKRRALWLTRRQHEDGQNHDPHRQMIVRITRILLLLQLLVAGAIAIALVEAYHLLLPAAVLAAFGIVLLVRFMITANNFRLAWRYRSETPPAFRISPVEACRLLLSEFHATMTSSSVTMPFHTFSLRLAEHATAMPVLLVHGYGCNSGYWHSMSKALTRAHISHLAIDMEPVFCGIDDYVEAIHTGVEKLCRLTGNDRIVIVAHSMGGLATRAYLRTRGSAQIAKVITLGTPHRGTGLALSGIGQNCAQMHWTDDGKDGLSSDWLQALANDERSRSQECYQRFVSIYSHHDNIIAPQSSSCLHGAKNIACKGIGHVQLAMSGEVQALVIEEILEASSGSLNM